MAAVGWLVLALLSSVGAAHLLYRLVEEPSLRLVRRIRLPPQPLPEGIPHLRP